MSDERPIRVAVLGAGPAAMAAVFELMCTPERRRRYEVTVYTDGWTLGGKGASGRNPAYGWRNEEHGLHVWMGFYDNCFSLIRRVCEALEPARDFRTLFRKSQFAVFQEWHEGSWRPWPLSFPVEDGFPGEGAPDPQGKDILTTFIDRVEAIFRAEDADPRSDTSALGWLWNRVEKLLSPAVKGFDLLRDAVSHGLADATSQAFAALDEFSRWLRDELYDAVSDNDALRRMFMLGDLTVATIRGVIADDLLRKGFATIDHEDLIDWFIRHGAMESSAKSPPVLGVYGAVFAFVDGDRARPSLAAGVGLRGMLRLFVGFHGAMNYVPRAGFGEAVFVPLYQVLSRWGVRFEFFHRVRALHLTDDGRRVAKVRVGVQAKVRGRRYEPVIAVPDRGMDSFPIEPDYSQLEDGDALRAMKPVLHRIWPRADVGERVLEAGADFDQVIMGLPLGVLPEVCAELVARPGNGWAEMLEHSKWVYTQSAQLWLKRTQREMGWTLGIPGQSNYVPPLDTMGDMTDVLAEERWPDGHTPKSLIYLTGTRETPSSLDLSDPVAAQDAEDQRLREQTRAWIEHASGHLWPKANRYGTPDALDWNELVDPYDRNGSQRLDAVFWNANLEPGYRYALSVPGSVKHRLAPDGSGVDNLYLAGDWTRTPLDAGCMEAAVMSGRMAARALTGDREGIVIAGEFWPDMPGPT